MKRYHFTVWNGCRILWDVSTTAKSIDVARNTVIERLVKEYGELAEHILTIELRSQSSFNF